MRYLTGFAASFVARGRRVCRIVISVLLFVVCGLWLSVQYVGAPRWPRVITRESETQAVVVERGISWDRDAFEAYSSEFLIRAPSSSEMSHMLSYFDDGARGRTVLGARGFRFHHPSEFELISVVNGREIHTRSWSLVVPFWQMAVVLGIFPGLRLARWMIHGLTQTGHPVGHCPKCGYDLRESKIRCPECGLRIARRKRTRKEAIPWQGEKRSDI